MLEFCNLIIGAVLLMRFGGEDIDRYLDPAKSRPLPAAAAVPPDQDAALARLMALM